ncbi:protein kinase [Candidatus Uabimicrobium sp. HlEnr_7]|uniref:protein kinase domain-containing protein n=1 Tax=Candidatus Uabimicrobium helgolandensis TaxID=3095367 RepID=UPI00355921B9
MPVNNRLFAYLKKFDTRSEVAKWSSTGEIIVVDINSLLWVPKGKNIAQHKICTSYKYKTVNSIVVANKKIILPADSIVLAPEISSIIKSLEVKVPLPKRKTALKKVVKNNAIWIGPNVENLSYKNAVLIEDAKNLLPDQEVKKKKPLVEEDLIKTQIISPQKVANENLLERHIIPPNKKVDQLWQPQEKQVDLFNNDFVVSKPVTKSNPAQPKPHHNKKQNALNNLKQTSRTPMRGSIAYQYRFEALYAKNRLGNLYFCEHRTSRNKCLALILHRQYSYSSVSVIKALAELRHRYILQIKDIGFYKGHTVVFMRAGKIIPLRMYLKENSLSIHQKLYLVQAIISAVEYAHKSKIRHGNLSISNIFMDQQGCPQIIGFNVKRTSPNCIPAGGLEEINSAIPMRLRLLPTEKRNDIVGIGYILFELIAGKPALRQDTMNKLQRRSGLRDVSFPKNLQKTIPRQLQFICLKAVDSRKDYSYKDLNELKEDINFLLSNKNYDDKWGFYAYRAKTWWGKHRDRANVYFIGITIFMSLWLVPSNLKVPAMLDPNAKTEEQTIAEIVEDLQSSDKVTCTLAIKKAGTLGEAAASVIPLLEKLTWHNERVISESAYDAIAKIQNKKPSNLELNAKNILVMLKHRFSDKRRQGLQAIEKLKNIDNAIIESLLSIASYDTSSHIREQAKQTLEEIELTENNFRTFTKLLNNRTALVKRLILKKLFSSSIERESVIQISIGFLDDYNPFNRSLAIGFLKKEIGNEDKWIRSLVPKLRKATIEMRQNIYDILGKITPLHPDNALYLAELLTEKNRYVNTYAQQSFEQVDMRYPESTSHLLKAFEYVNKQGKEWILRGLAETDYKSTRMIPIVEKALLHSDIGVRRWGAICAGRMRRLAVPLIPELEALLKDATMKKEAQEALNKIR